jgi:hypothetical protein
MTEIPVNDGDNAKSRMDKFVEYAVKRLNKDGYAQISDEPRCNEEGVPGISYSEARELVRMFAAKSYHASAYYIDFPLHGFRYVTISKGVCQASSARCSHTSVWA